MNGHLYLVALGSNQWHRRIGRPRAVLESAFDALEEVEGCEVLAASPIITSRPIGPSQREYANAAAVVRCALTPQAMLGLLQAIELLHERHRRGQRWRARTLDLDIVLWSGGIVADPALKIPHPLFRGRAFVLGPAAAIAPDWRDPITNLSLRQLHSRLTQPRPLPR